MTLPRWIALAFTGAGLLACGPARITGSGGVSAGSSASSGSAGSSRGASSGIASSSGSGGTQGGASSSSSSASASSSGASSSSSSASASSSGASSSSSSATASSSGASSGTSGAGASGGTTGRSPLDLDETGATIPDTDYPIPPGAIFLATTGDDANPGTLALPVATLNRAFALVPVGGTLVIRGGRYRDWLNTGAGGFKTASTGFTLQPYPHEQVWFDGTDVVAASSFTPDGAGHWTRAWSTPQFCANGYYAYPYDAQPTTNTGPCTHFDMYGDPNNPAAGDPQMVFIDGQPIHEAGSLSGATGANFFYDWSARRIDLATNPAGHTVELATRPVAMVLGGTHGWTVRGLGFTRYATNEYSNATSGALVVGQNSTVEDCVFTRMAGQALNLGATNGVLRHAVLAFNGYNGMGSNGHQHSTGAPDGLLIEDSVINANNQEHFGVGCSASCGQAGIKIAHMDGFTVRNNIFEHTVVGHGFWCDLACSNGVMIYNHIHHNAGSGLFYEVSDTGILASNLIHDNGGYGVRVGSANTRIFNNTLVNNTGSGGIWVYDDSRSPGVNGWTDVGPDTTNVSVVNNLVVDTVGSNTMVRASAPSTGSPYTEPPQFFSAFDSNGYWRTTSNQLLVRWILRSGEADYRALATFQAATGFEAHGLDVAAGTDPFFVDLPGGDYRVRSGSAANQSGTPLPADVAAALGQPTGAVLSRGAITWPGGP